MVSILQLGEDGFHKLDEGYGIYVLLQYLMWGEDFLLLVVDPSRKGCIPGGGAELFVKADLIKKVDIIRLDGA